MKRSYDQLGKNIAHYRRRAGMTQDMLAVSLGVSMQAVSKWERNLSCPDMAFLTTLSRLLAVTIDELFAVREEETERYKLEDVPWDDDGRYRLALFCGKELLAGETYPCEAGGDLVVHVRIPEDGERGRNE